ncbi:hypothetical protein CsatA_008664 [Cannabis sativa]
MLRKCSGLPLAIIVLAGLLSKNHTLYDWELMKENVIRCIGQDDQQHDDDLKYRSVSRVLGLSYSELTSHLKPCFLYLARYGEDVTIRVKESCLVLIEEGFIWLRRGCVAYDWLSQLVERSMIQVKQMSLKGRIKSFCIHDLMRELCVSKAQEENFLHSINCRNQWEEPIETNVRRVSIYNNERIGNLIHLRLLSILSWRIEKIPSSFGNLRCLQTLRVATQSANIPNSMCKLEQLRHLYFYTDAVGGILVGIHTKNLGLSDFLQLKSLNKLEISITRMKLKLFSLKLEDDPMPTLEKLPKLRVLVIGYETFIGDEMACSRGGFPRLESLQLIFMKNLKEWKVEMSALPRLAYLCIHKCWTLRSVPDGVRNISTLIEIKISNMPKEFKERIEEGGEDFHKVKHDHVLSLYISTSFFNPGFCLLVFWFMFSYDLFYVRSSQICNQDFSLT